MKKASDKNAAREVLACDLFCGAGGTSKGLLDACTAMGLTLDLIAINHWQIAIDTHKVNHPYAKHLCESIDVVDPRKLVPGGRLNVLVASPECTHHSNARGGRPMNDQSRASAFHILRWAEALYIESILVENVKEFRSWGPLGADGRPIKKLKGELFRHFIDGLKALGYKVEYRILNAADYGDPTTRERIFVIARRGNRRIIWPKQSHAAPEKLKQSRLFDAKPLLPWVPARNIIDWSLPSKSIFNRKKPLAVKTIERIYSGFEKFGGPNAEPFLIILRQHMASRSVDMPLPTLTAGGNHVGLVESTIVNMKGKSKARSINSPLPTQTTKQHLFLADPIILPHNLFGQAPADSIDRPLRTLVGKNARQIRIAEPVLIPFFGERKGQKPRAHSVDEPLPTVTGHGAGAVVEPFMLNIDHRGNKGNAGKQDSTRSVDKPLSTITTKARNAVVESFLVDVNHGQCKKSGKSSRTQSINKPLSTVTTKRGKGVVQPCIVKYYGTAKAQSVEAPLDTVTTKDRFSLVTGADGGLYKLDIRLRMLRPHELAAAMSLGGYKFTGRMEDQVKQIGNAVAKQTAQALCSELLQ